MCAPAVSQCQTPGITQQAFCTFPEFQDCHEKKYLYMFRRLPSPAVSSGGESSRSCVCHDPVPQCDGTGIFYHVCYVPIERPGGACTPVYMLAVDHHYIPASAGTCLHLCRAQVLPLGGMGMQFCTPSCVPVLPCGGGLCKFEYSPITQCSQEAATP